MNYQIEIRNFATESLNFGHIVAVRKLINFQNFHDFFQELFAHSNNATVKMMILFRLILSNLYFYP